MGKRDEAKRREKKKKKKNGVGCHKFCGNLTLEAKMITPTWTHPIKVNQHTIFYLNSIEWLDLDLDLDLRGNWRQNYKKAPIK